MKNKKGIFLVANEKQKKMAFSINENSQIIIKKNEFLEKTYKKITYIATKTNIITSIGTSLIPFIEHNDGNRTLMGSNMQKQAIAIQGKEKPLIQTGNEKKIATESSYIIRTKKEGIFKQKLENKIIIKEIKNKLDTKKISHSITTKMKKKLKENMNIVKKNRNYKLRTYNVQKNLKINQNFYLEQTIIKENKKYTTTGEILTNNSHIKYGNLCLGKNLLIGYIPLEGYNFEDAIIINKSIINQEILKSIHIKKYLTFKMDNEMGKVRKLSI